MPLLPVATLALWCAAAAPRKAATPEQEARAAVSEFVLSDLHGRPERYQNAELSPERLRAAQPEEGSEELPDTGLLFDVASEPFVAVTSYRLVGVEVKGATGSAVLEFGKVAEFDGRELRESAGGDRVVLALRHDGRRWWVVDPPPARVDAAAAAALLDTFLKAFGPEWEARVTPEQRAWRDRLADGLRVLQAAADRAKAAATPARR
jgi:hypothetical protein